MKNLGIICILVAVLAIAGCTKAPTPTKEETTPTGDLVSVRDESGVVKKGVEQTQDAYATGGVLKPGAAGLKTNTTAASSQQPKETEEAPTGAIVATVGVGEAIPI